MTRTSIVIILAALASLASACRGETVVKADPQTQSDLDNCKKNLDEKDKLIKAEEEENARLMREKGSGAEIVVSIEGNALTVKPGKPGEVRPVDDKVAAAASKEFLNVVAKSRGAIQKCYEQALKKNGCELLEEVSDLNYSVSLAEALLSADPKYGNADVAKFGFVYENNAPWDLIASNIMKDPARWDEWREILRPDGIRVADLAPEQRALVAALLDEILGVYRPALAAEYWKTVDLDKLSFAWIGSLEPKQPHYYRLQGADFVFEYDNVQGNGNHIHEVWRSRSGDFGDDLLKRHYETSH